jgi:hypothetical protein
MANINNLKAWVRYDGKGRLVGGGPIVQAHKPKNGDWVEIPFYSYCCNNNVTYYNVAGCERMEYHVIKYNGPDELVNGTIVNNATPECWYIIDKATGPEDVGVVTYVWDTPGFCVPCVDSHTTTTTSTSSTSTTTTTTTLPPTTRVSFLNSFTIIFRGGTFANTGAMYAGNTIANITSTNPTYQMSGLKCCDNLTFRGELFTNTYLANPSATPDVIVPTYTTTDSGGNPILGTLQDFYEYNKKIITDSFLSTRSPVVNIFRATNPGYTGALDGWFIVAIDFDATGLEEYAITRNVKEYQILSLPSTITYPIVFQLPLSVNVNDGIGITPITQFPPSSTWTVGQTIGDWVIQEIFTIPITW